MENTPVSPDVVANVIAMMKKYFSGDFKSFYDGDPLVIPKESLPAVIVEKVAGQIKTGATGTDDFSSQLNVKLVMNKMDDFNARDDVDLTELKLRRFVEARDPATRQYLPGTVLYVLRQNITLGGQTLDMQIDVNYDLRPRGRSLMTSEAVVSVITRERVLRGQQLT